ncbi:hypothetical protein LSAT2_005320 [Lamellibrachia satsuma]|nr:hypothetical protein LSAT2_005320 [Lamellibrachia satsuma]
MQATSFSQHDFELTRPPRRHLFHQSSLMDNYVEDKMADWGMHHMIETFRAKELFLLCEDVLYEVDFLVKAVDICFKVFFIFNAEYPAKAADVWTFVQKGLFNITTPYDVVTPREMELLGHIKC